MVVAGLLLNVVIMALLAATIGYCWALNRRIKILQDSKSELAQLLKYFDESTTRASESIIGLQTASKKIGENIQLRIDKANFLLDDMAFMIEKGNKIANQMEAGFAVSRARNRIMHEQHEPEEAMQELPPPSKAVPVIERPIAELPAARPAEKTASTREKTAASLEAVLERVVGRSKSPSAPAPMEEMETQVAPRAAATRARSKTEQELLNMLKAGVKG